MRSAAAAARSAAPLSSDRSPRYPVRTPMFFSALRGLLASDADAIAKLSGFRCHCSTMHFILGLSTRAAVQLGCTRGSSGTFLVSVLVDEMRVRGSGVSAKKRFCCPERWRVRGGIQTRFAASTTRRSRRPPRNGASTQLFPSLRLCSDAERDQRSIVQKERRSHSWSARRIRSLVTLLRACPACAGFSPLLCLTLGRCPARPPLLLHIASPAALADSSQLLPRDRSLPLASGASPSSRRRCHASPLSARCLPVSAAMSRAKRTKAKKPESDKDRFVININKTDMGEEVSTSQAEAQDRQPRSRG